MLLKVMGFNLVLGISEEKTLLYIYNKKSQGIYFTGAKSTRSMYFIS